MKAFIASLLFFALLGIRVPVSFAQPDQNYQKLAQEMEDLKKQFSALQSQLQTVENTDKMKLLTELDDAKAKLADANAKLINAEFGKFERELRNSNDDWLQTWTIVFLSVIGVFAAILFGISRAYWYWLSSKTEELIGNGVEKRLNEFTESIDKVNILENKIRVLDKEHAAEVLERFMHYRLSDEDSHPEQIKELKEEALLDVFCDETRHPDITNRAAEVLTHRQSTQLVSPAFELLNSTLDSHQDKELELYTASHLRYLVDLLGYIRTEETYEGLKEYLNRLLLRENTEFKALLLAATSSSFAWVSHELKKEDWISLLKTSFSHLGNEPETIKDILSYIDEEHSVDDLDNYFLELLEKHDPQFVNDWRERRAAANTETEETS